MREGWSRCESCWRAVKRRRVVKAWWGDAAGWVMVVACLKCAKLREEAAMKVSPRALLALGPPVGERECETCGRVEPSTTCRACQK